MKIKTKTILKIYFVLFFLFFYFVFSKEVFAADPKLITTLTGAFEKIEKYIVKISTPAAAVAVGSGILMKKFSFGDEERIRVSKKVIRGSLFSYGFILVIDLVLSLMETLLK